MDLIDLSVVEALARMRGNEISSEELTRAYLTQIERLDRGVLHAYVTVTPKLALEQACIADRRRRTGDEAPLLGVPMALKDLVLTKDVRTTCSSKILADFLPAEDATITRRLYHAGAILLGKTNMDEFGMGSSTENSAFFATRNPWGDLTRVPGGSSGGSAAAVAARLAPFAIGSDTGGSIRQPAALCGVVGLKPTYGRVSRYGLIAYASSLDQLGPLTVDVADCALVTGVIAGHDPLDSTSLDAAVPSYSDALDGRPPTGSGNGLRGVRIGVPREYFVAGMEAGVEQSVRAALDVLRGLGAELDEVSLPHTDYALAAYYIIAPAECSANLARYDGVKYGYSAPDAETMWDGYYKTRGRGFGSEVKRRIMLGTYALSSGYYDAYYLKAQKIRTLIKQDFDAAFERFDALVAPTSPTVAFKLGEKTDDPLAMYLSDVCTLPVNLAGLPGLSVPCGLSEGLPVGLQVIGKPLDEPGVLRIARAYEQAGGWDRRRPELSS